MNKKQSPYIKLWNFALKTFCDGFNKEWAEKQYDKKFADFKNQLDKLTTEAYNAGYQDGQNNYYG